MYCPSCGSEERQASQFCRACGSDLRAVRLSLERPDSITASAVTAREEIGRAVAEDVLPQIEKFLESPEEKRLRRMRAGVVVSSIGIGVTIMMLLLGSIAREADVQGFMAGGGAGIVLFFIGLGLLLNAFFFTRPRKDVTDHAADAQTQNALDANYAAPSQLRGPTTSNLVQSPGSITEHTTLHLKSER